MQQRKKDLCKLRMISFHQRDDSSNERLGTWPRILEQSAIYGANKYKLDDAILLYQSFLQVVATILFYVYLLLQILSNDNKSIVAGKLYKVLVRVTPHFLCNAKYHSNVTSSP